MSRGPVVGDPASVSRSGVAARASARELIAAATGLTGAAARLDRTWTGRAALSTHSALSALSDAAREVAAELDATGTALQAHASCLAKAVRDGRMLAERVHAAGLRLEDGVVAFPLGLRGGTDPEVEADLAERRRALQGELDLLRLRAASARGQLRALLAASHERLAATARATRA